MTSDLVARLVSAIAETERIARAAGGPTAAPPDPWVRDGMTVRSQQGLRGTIVVKHSWPNEIAHIVRNDPPTVLRRCVVDRRTLARHTPITDSFGKPICGYCESGEDGGGRLPAPCDDLVDVAERYGITEGVVA